MHSLSFSLGEVQKPSLFKEAEEKVEENLEAVEGAGAELRSDDVSSTEPQKEPAAVKPNPDKKDMRTGKSSANHQLPSFECDNRETASLINEEAPKKASEAPSSPAGPILSQRPNDSIR